MTTTDTTDDDVTATEQPEAEVDTTGETTPPEDATDDVTPEEDTPPADDTTDEDAETFPREYVQDLRQESANYRTQLRTTQERLHRVLVEQTGQLADPADLPFDPAHLDGDNLATAIEDLIAAKPHLKARRFDPGAAAQGPKQPKPADVDLLGIMRSHL
jgi:hypothetical protein